MQINDDGKLSEMLSDSKVVAVVGHSDKPYRTSYQIAQYLRNAGYTVYPVNPMVDQIDGEKSYASLAEIPVPIDIVDVFRRSEHLRSVVDEAAKVGAKAVWAQQGVYDAEAANLAEQENLDIVMDRCIKIDHRRLIA
jgi:predicted CoA-binding protein